MKPTVILYVVVFCVLTTGANAQLYRSAFHGTWSTTVPLTDKNYTGQTSSAGMRVGFSKFINDRFAVGIEGGYTTLDDYVPRTTYEFPGGAITTDVFNYLYYMSLVGNAQYYFVQGKKFMPYASVGMGVAFSEYRIYYNVYADGERNTSFVARPELGTLFRIKEYSSWGFKASLSYDYATNKSEYMGVNNFSAIGIQIGFVLLAD